MVEINTTPEQRAKVLEYMTQIGFNGNPDNTQHYIDMCCYIELDSMGLIDPIEIAMIRSIVGHPISKRLAKNCKMSADQLKAVYNNLLLETITK